MPNSAQVIYNEIDQSFFVESAIQGINAVFLKTLRGPYGLGDELITSWTQFQRIYGGENVNFPGVTRAKRALIRGSMLRVVKIGHYTTIGNPATLDAVKAAIDESGPDFAIVTGAIDAFDAILKNPGADYNNLQFKITAASNGATNSFNLEINHLLEPLLNEKYENLTIPGTPTVINSHYMDDVVAKSKFVSIVYKDLSAQAGPLRPINGTWATIGGTNGGAVVDADYVGDPAGTGLYYLQNKDDFECFAALDNESLTWNNAASAYAQLRQDCIAVLHLPNSTSTASGLATLRGTYTIDSRYTYMVAGGLKIRNPFVNSDTQSIMDDWEVGDVLGIFGKTAAQYGPWYSPAGSERGNILDAFGVVNNYAPGGSANLNLLAQRQINAVVSIGGNIYLKGNFSGQQATSRKSFINVVRLLIYIKKSLRPTLDRYLEQPNDFRIFRELYNEVQPFFDDLASTNKRALQDYEWRGDQFANTDADLKINTRNDLDQGKYKVQLWLKEIVSLQELTIDIISAPSGVTFDDNVNQ